MQAATACNAVREVNVENDRTPRAVGRKRRRSQAGDIASHPSPTGYAAFAKASPGQLQRHLPADFTGVEIAAVTGILHRAPVHYCESVAELAGKVEVLFDQHDRDSPEAAQIRDRPADVLDD